MGTIYKHTKKSLHYDSILLSAKGKHETGSKQQGALSWKCVSILLDIFRKIKTLMKNNIFSILMFELYQLKWAVPPRLNPSDKDKLLAM